MITEQVGKNLNFGIYQSDVKFDNRNMKISKRHAFLESLLWVIKNWVNFQIIPTQSPFQNAFPGVQLRSTNPTKRTRESEERGDFTLC